MIKYLYVPSLKSYFRAIENCCFDIISFDPENPGMTRKKDRDGDLLDSSILLCKCHPTITILEISEPEYENKKQEMQDILRRNNKAEC